MVQSKISKTKLPLISLIIIFLFAACGGDPTPKPKAYFRIDMPEKQYQKLDTSFPYSFEYPKYAEITPDRHSPDEKYWINVYFPNFKGNLHLSYKKVNNNLITYLEDARTMVVKHIPKSSGIDNILIEEPQRQVYGMKYRIHGLGTASPYQFFVTDSANHFLRGALYFNIIPNNDSLAPVINFLIEDIEHLINTVEWKN